MKERCRRRRPDSIERCGGDTGERERETHTGADIERMKKSMKGRRDEDGAGRSERGREQVGGREGREGGERLTL